MLDKLASSVLFFFFLLSTSATHLCPTLSPVALPEGTHWGHQKVARQDPLRGIPASWGLGPLASRCSYVPIMATPSSGMCQES